MKITQLKEQFKFCFKKAEFAIALFLILLTAILNNRFSYIGFIQFSLSDILLLIAFFVKIISVASRNYIPLIFSKKHLIFILITIWITFKIIHTQKIDNHSFSNILPLLYLPILYCILNGSFNKENFLFLIKNLLYISTVYNSIKIILFKFEGYQLNSHESLRVLHSETDIICASLSLIIISAMPQFFSNKQKIIKYILIVLNLTIILLSFKRTALIGLLATLPIIFFMGNKQSRTNIKQLLLVSAILFIGAFGTIFILNKQNFNNVQTYLAERFSPGEKNAQWRLKAWDMAIENTNSYEITGIPLNKPILDKPIGYVIASSPHNSFIAFYARYGIVGIGLLIALIIQAMMNIDTLYKESSDKQMPLLLLAGLTFMTIFASFNPVLASKSQNIFYLLFILLPIALTTKEQTIKKSPNSAWVLTIGGIMLYFGLYSFFLKSHKIPIYSKSNTLISPIITQSNNENESTAAQLPEGLLIKSTGSYAEINWLLPEIFKLKSDIDISKYTLRIKSIGKKTENIDTIYLVDTNGKRYCTKISTSDNYNYNVIISDSNISKKEMQNLQSFTFIFESRYNALIREVYLEYVQ